MSEASKIALVTGGTAGVGRSIVLALAQQGAEVHFIGTNDAKGKRVERELGLPEGAFIRLDLSDLGSVRAFARRFASANERVDVLVNVAGVMLPTRQVTSEGNEKTFAIDHLASFVLCHELASTLERAAHGRIVNVSGAPKQLLPPSLDFDDLQLERGYSLMRAAINAVHAKTVMTEILAEKLRPRGIDVNAFHPGAVKSDLFRHMNFPMNLIFRFARTFMSESSVAGVYASTAEELNGVTGQFFVKTRARPLRFDRSYKERLWDATLDALPFDLR